MSENIKREFVSYGNESTYRDDKKLIFEYLCHLKNTVNELVDVVNKQQDIIRQIGEWGSRKGECLWCDTLTEFNPERAQKETFVSIDEALKMGKNYAEQKKWIGKLCKFYKDGEMVSIDILRAVAEEGTFFPFRSTKDWYEHCEPVSPTDDIIYKKD